MAETFTTSNKRVITHTPENDSYTITWGEWNSLSSFDHLNKHDMDALREYILHELGIWQDPETGAIVLREGGRDDTDGRCITVHKGGVAERHWEGVHTSIRERAEIKARYFAAHPKPAPNPWLEAKPGEAWQLTIDGVTGAYVLTTAGMFYGVANDDLRYWGKHDNRITAGVRMVAESEATE